MRLAAITVNYCCAAEILPVLNATSAQIAASGGEWWIVDNKSPDNSIQLLRDPIATVPNVHLVEAPRNGGFGYGNNRVLNKILNGEIQADYVYFLNPDAVPQAGSIEAMAAYLDANENVGVVGSGLVNEDGSPTESMFRFPSFWSEIEQAISFRPISWLLRNYRQALPQLNVPGPVDWVAGTSFMARTSVLRKVGGFDEDFFLYWEEVEFCYRIRRSGFAIHGLPSAKVRHVGGVSTGMHRPDRRIPAYWHRSRNLYYRKTRGAGPVPFLNFVVALSLSLRRSLQLLRRAPLSPPQFLRDHITAALRDFSGAND